MEKLKQIPHMVPWKAEEAGPLPCSPFPGEGSSFRPGRADGELDEAGKMKLPLLFFLCSYSCFYLFVCSTILLKFLVWTPELPQSYFCSQIAVKLLIFVGGWRLASPNPVFLWYPSQLNLNITNQGFCASTKHPLFCF